MRTHATTAPLELIDPDGEGVYVRCRPSDNTLRRAAELLGCYWREIETTAVSMIPNEDNETWLPVSFRNWRWRLWPFSVEPAVYLYCTPTASQPPASTEGSE